MCCAQTAAPEGKIKHCREGQKRGDCRNKDNKDTTQQVPPKFPKTQPSTVPNLPKINARSCPGRKNAPMRRHRHGQEGSRCALNSPRGGQERPTDARDRAKAGQDPPKRVPDPPNTESGELSDWFLARSWWEALFGRLLE